MIFFFYYNQAEHLGAQGKVDEAQNVIGMCDTLKEEKEQLKAELEASMEQEKLMEVCEICGCFLIVGDTDQRIGEHLTGKQHMGFAKIKATVDELLVSFANKTPEWPSDVNLFF